MVKALKTAFLICAICFAVFSLFFHFASPGTMRSAQQNVQNISSKQNAALALPDGHSYSAVLFPDLAAADVIAVSVKTPDRSFDFCRDEQGNMQVNGLAADEEICATLLDQILDLPVCAVRAIPDENTHLLSLHLSTKEQQNSIYFFADGGAQTEAFIRSGPRESPKYYQTDGWRVGTLMMTCEGAPIQAP